MYRALRLGLVTSLVVACSSDTPTAPGETCTIRGLSLAQTAFTMTVGQGVSVPSLIDQAGCRTLPAVVWSTSDAAVVSTSNDGTITAIGVGTATVTARLDGRNDQASATVTVRGRVMGLSVTPTTATVDVGGTLQLGATLSADPGTPGTLRWVSSDSSRASVASSGRVTGLAAGTATVTAIAEADTTRRASVVVTVRPRVLSLAVSPGRDTLFVSDTVSLRVTLQGDSGVVRDVSWRSSHPNVASVSGSGLVTALAAGEVEVIVTSIADSTRTARAIVLVLPRVLGVTVNPESATLDVGATRSLVAAVTGDSGISTAVTWQSSNPAAATVSGSGVVTGVAVGTTVITVRSVADPSRAAQANVLVRARVIAVSVSPAVVTMVVGGSSTITATVSGDPGVAAGVTWSSANTAIATVSSVGVVTGVGAGTTTVTATSVADPTKVASATVTVTTPVPPPPPPPPTQAICFGMDTGTIGERIAPGSPQVGLRQGGLASTNQLATNFGCVTSFVDLAPGQSVALYALRDGVQVSVNWQLPATSVASFVSDPDFLGITAQGAGTVTVVASVNGQQGTLVIRVGGPSPAGFCLATSSGGPCATAATAKVGQPFTVFAQAGGQAVGGVLAVLNPVLPVPPHLVSAMRLVFPSAGQYLVLASAMAGTNQKLMLVTVTP